MHQYGIRIFRLQHLIHLKEQTPCQFRQCLIRSHDIHIDIWLDIEKIKNLIQHLAMLGGG
ncbi:hypothetical protein A9976_13330 [Delftia sp. UME58]|nr:hypothetical protein [Delftia sp. UME58]